MDRYGLNTDQEMLAAWREGRSGGEDWVFERFYQPLCYFAEKLTGSGMVGEDLASEAFVQLLEIGGEFESVGALGAWLYTTVRHDAYDYIKAEKRHQKVHEALEWEKGFSEEAVDLQLIRAEVLMAIRTAIAGLPEHYRGVIELALLEGKKNEEIAELLNIAYQTVRNYKTAGLKLLRISMQGNRGLSLGAMVYCIWYLQNVR